MDWQHAHWLLTPGQPAHFGGRITIDRNLGCLSDMEILGKSPTDITQGTTFLTPGLINAHTHLELSAVTPIPIAPSETYGDWLLKVVAHRRSQTEAEIQQACRQGIAEAIRTGTTCVNDITSEGLSLELLSQIGMRGIVSPEFFYPAHDPDPQLDTIVTRFEALKKRFGNHPLLRLGISPHSAYNVTPQAFDKILQEIQPVLVHTHLGETPDELEWFETGHASFDQVHETLLGQYFGPIETETRPLTHLTKRLDQRWCLAHVVELSENELETLIRHHVGTVHCPRSNQWLSGKTISNLAERLEKGLAIGLGTDSRLSCPNLDLRAEGRFAQHQHGLSAQHVFELMTLGSAKAIHQDDHLGQLSPGYAADMVLWWTPETFDNKDPYEAWLSKTTQAITVWINGRVVLDRSPDEQDAWAD